MPNGTHDSVSRSFYVYYVLLSRCKREIKSLMPWIKTLTKALFYAGIKLKLPSTFRFKDLFTFLCRRKLCTSRYIRQINRRWLRIICRCLWGCHQTEGFSSGLGVGVQVQELRHTNPVPEVSFCLPVGVHFQPKFWFIKKLSVNIKALCWYVLG